MIISKAHIGFPWAIETLMNYGLNARFSAFGSFSNANE